VTSAAVAASADVIIDGRVSVRWSERPDGDFHLDLPAVQLRRARRSLVDLPWTQLDQCHGSTVVAVDRPGGDDGAVGDALVSDLAGVVLAIWTGDCAPVAFATSSEWFGAAHAGWRGIERGVLGATVAALRERTSSPVVAVLGPCIHPCCYEFGAADLARLEARFGSCVRGRTSSGSLALDVPATIRAALAELEVPLTDHSICTGCEAARFFSHRARRDIERQVMAVWRTPSSAELVP
jgi:YfiH family protein